MLSAKDIKIKTLHETFYWDIFWCISGFDFGKTFLESLTKEDIIILLLELTIKNYWKHVSFPFPVNGISIDRACKIIRITLIKKGCIDNEVKFKLRMVKDFHFFSDNNPQWKKLKKIKIY